MAKKGLEYVCYGMLQEDGTYKNGKYVGPTAKFQATATTNSVKDYGDNGVVATDTSVTNGTVSLEINEMVNQHHASLLGHTYDTETDEVRCNRNDIAPYVGIGCLGMSTGAKPFKVVVYLKAQFKEPSDEYDTMQETVTFNHSTLEGDFYTLENGDYSIKKGFDTKQQAKDYLNKLLGIATEE